MFYHLTALRNVAGIQAQGLKANDVENTIAKQQVFLKSYALFQVDPTGLTSEAWPDEVAEYAADYQRMVFQAVIEPRYLTLLGEFHVSDTPTEWDYRAAERSGWPRWFVDEQMACDRAGNAGEIDQQEWMRRMQALVNKLKAQQAL